MDYRLEVFCRVAEHQSISAAARALRISQPAVTQHIKMLEESFSVALFLRSRNGVILTEAGVLLLAHARRVAGLEEEVAQKLRGPGSVLGGRIRLGASTTVIQYYLPGVLARFKQRYPVVEVEVLEGNSEAMIGALLAQRIEMGLIEAPCRRRDLRAQGFFEDEIVVIAAPNEPLVEKRSVTLQHLMERPLIMREQGSGTRQVVEGCLHKLKVDTSRLRIIQELPSTEAIKRVVAAGLGLGFVSRISIQNEIADGSLVVMPVRHLSIRRPFSVILPLGPDPIGLRQVFLGFLGQDVSSVMRNR